MHDGSAKVLFASCSTPDVALVLVRDTWRDVGNGPIEIRVYRGGKLKSEGPPLVRWGA
jgi:hypothetical protein